ncbi:MAG: hypothetical protein DMG72_04600 [Acidobacteria bacterium]|nr:MAG: hypothetical protein DMG72_04600 [Acidobacteriota bacterium]
MAEDQMTLGEFVKFLAALLTKNSTRMLFKDEARWHTLFYQLQEEDFEDKPEFMGRLIFDWGGPFPKCKDLSRYLQLLHVTGCVGVTNPSYKEMELNPGLEKLWYSQVEELPPAQRKFVEHAAALAEESFSLAK